MANLVSYPDTGYNSYGSEDEADNYLESRLGGDDWANCTNKEAALITAFHMLQEFNFSDDFDLTDSDILTAAQKAQFEQALHLVKHDLDEMPLKQLGLGGLLQVSPDASHDTPELAPRAAGFLRDYLIRPGVTRVR
jgi:hypothetical protein